MREQRDAIVAEWLRRVRESLPVAEGMPGPAQKGLDALPTLHALDRNRIGFDVRAVLGEYAILRQVILARIPAAAQQLLSLRALHRPRDRARPRRQRRGGRRPRHHRVPGGLAAAGAGPGAVMRILSAP